MRIYEELFIVRPDATDEEVDPVIEQVKNIVTHAGGTLDKTETGFGQMNAALKTRVEQAPA